MAEVTIGLSDAALDEFAARAARCGRSLEDYLTDELEYLALKPAPETWLELVRAQVRQYGADIATEQNRRAEDADRP